MSDELAEGGSKFYSRCSCTVDSYMTQMATRRLAGKLAGWSNGLPLSPTNKNKILRKNEKFDSRGRSTKGMVIGNEACQKLDFDT